MKRVKVGIIGQGRSGRDIHAQWLLTMPERYQIVAVADPLEDRQKQARTEMKCDAFPDLGSMLKARKDIDLVVNASPSHLHIPLTEQALESGFNVISDKPFGRRAADVDRVIKKAKKAKRLLAIFQQARFAPYFQQVKAVCDSGVLGRIVMVKVFFNGFARRWDWQTLRKFDGGSLLNTGPHPMDQVLHFIGRDAMPNVFCVMDKVNSFGNAEDHVKIILTRKGHPTIDYEVSSCTAYNPYTYQVYGSRGSLAGTQKHIEWKYFKESEAPKQKLIEGPMPERAYCSENLVWHEDKWDAPKEAENAFKCMTTRIYENVHDALCKGTELEVKPEQVRLLVAIMEEAHRQNKSYPREAAKPAKKSSRRRS